MKLNLSQIKFEGEWYAFKDSEILIRPIPLSKQRLGVNLEFSENLKANFVYCLADWKNVFDENGKEIKLTDEIRGHIFDFGPNDLRNFVLEKVKEQMDKLSELEKN